MGNNNSVILGEKSAIVLAASGRAADIYIDSNGKDYNGLKLVADSFVKDINMVTGITPEVITDTKLLKGTVIIAGSIGNNNIIDSLISQGILELTAIKGKRECYKLQVIEKPFVDVEKAIIIAGSDKRGTIYGIYHISEIIGVSPWVYWGDVIPRKQSELIIPEDKLNMTSKEPSVKYRGFFLNDEWPSLGSWATGTFGDFNEEFYDKVFQLILRLKGNFLWPAMWSAIFSENGKSSPLANAKLADAYGVVMGTSHHEPMLRAGEEWKKINQKYGTNPLWDFSSNPEAITKFWEDGLIRNKGLESLITIGMRGEQDSALKGSMEENIALLKKIITTQKELLKKHGQDSEPQVLTIYKEVEKYWFGSGSAEGLRNWEVLDDVTIMLADDNFGNVRAIPEEYERNRKAGWGMYYHFDYHGGPRSYEWVNTTPIVKTWEQMSMAYDYGIRDIWIVNVGDLKPLEFPISYYFDLAYDFSKWGIDGSDKIWDYTKEWARQQFGNAAESDVVNEIAQIIRDYTKMSGCKKPEVTFASTYSITNYNEAQKVLDKAIDLEVRTEKYYNIIKKDYRDAYYQLIYYPTVASANIVKMQIYAGFNNFYYDKGSILANYYAELVEECKEKDVKMQKYYNDEMSGGKWKGIMQSPHIGYMEWQPDSWTYPQVKTLDIPTGSKMILDKEDEIKFSNLVRENHSITISNGGSEEFGYIIEKSADWIKVYNISDSIRTFKTLTVAVDWDKITQTSEGFITITGAGKSIKIKISAEIIDTEGLPDMTFVEANNVLSIEAEHAAARVAKSNVEWKVIKDYGRTLSSVKMFPITVSFERPEEAPYLEYIIKVNSDAEYELTTYTAPSNNLCKNSRLRYGVSFDEGNITVADTLPKDFFADSPDNGPWCNAVLDNIHIVSTMHKLTKGVHKLRFYGIDAGLVLQKLVLSDGKLPVSFFGPEESFCNKK